MLILLPPSEGKAAPAEGEPVDLDSLAFAAELGERRATLLDALERLVELPAPRAVKQLADSLLAVRAFSESDGRRKPVSHMAKAVRGDVARALLLAKKVPADPGAAAAVAREAGFEVELSGSNLDVIVTS